MSISDSNFWGPVTSTIDWCEPNYNVSPFIAEPANTLSNLSFVLLGLLGALHEFRQVLMQQSRTSYIFLHAGVFLIGVGSMLFHGTLRIWGQQLDELPMVWYLLTCMYIVNYDYSHNFHTRRNSLITADVTSLKEKNSFDNLNKITNTNTENNNDNFTMPISNTSSQINLTNRYNSLSKYVLPLYGIVFSVLHMVFKTTTAFQVHFGLLLSVVLFRIFQKYKQQYFDLNSNQKFIIYLFASTGFLGFFFWLIDYHHCSYFHMNSIYPFGHVLWHIFMGYSAYCSVLMIKILDMMRNKQELMVIYKFGIIPMTYGIMSQSMTTLDDYKDIENSIF